MVTPFVLSPEMDRVSQSNPCAWLILRPACDGAWEPWGRLECWRERGGADLSDSLGYRFDLLVPSVDLSVPIADAAIAASKGGKFALDLTAAQSLSRGSTPGCSPRRSGDFSQWPPGNYRRFVMSAAVQGEGRCSKPTVEVGVAHVGCAEDAVAFVALGEAVDLSMDALTRTQAHRHISGDLRPGHVESDDTHAGLVFGHEIADGGQRLGSLDGRERAWCGGERRETRERVPTCSYRDTSYQHLYRETRRGWSSSFTGVRLYRDSESPGHE
ncbi:hypothetical protein ACQ4PT_020423 [Festuca glaucescens]